MGGLVGWWVGGLVSCLVGCLLACLLACLPACLVGWLVGHPKNGGRVALGDVGITCLMDLHGGLPYRCVCYLHIFT